MSDLYSLARRFLISVRSQQHLVVSAYANTNPGHAVTDQASARLLAQRLVSLLHRFGHYVLRSSDLRYWADLIESRGGWVNPSFLPELHGDRGEFLAIFTADDRFGATIAWRSIKTDDYAARMRAGTEWAPDATAVGWTEWPVERIPLIAGHVHDRGGLFVAPEAQGNRLSWYLTGLQWCAAIDDRADWVVSHTLPKVSATKLPRAIYGYENLAIMPEHPFPWHPQAIATAVVWSDTHAIRQEVARRLRFLRQCHAQDLRAAAVGYERYQQAIEDPNAVRPAPMDEGEPATA